MLAVIRTAQAKVDADRSALYAREAAGEQVTHDEWMALGERQIVVTAAADVTGVHPCKTPAERIDSDEVAPRYREHVHLLVAYALA